MGSTTRKLLQEAGQEIAANIRWRNWPLVEQRRWSWLAVCGILGTGGFVWYAGGGWLLALAAAVGLAGTIWPFLLPVQYEIDSLGLRRSALGRSRLVAWHAVRAYQLRPTGVILYRRADPTPADVLRSFFVPFPEDEDAMLCALREHLPHAIELPQ
jgi:hypothetical protein